MIWQGTALIDAPFPAEVVGDRLIVGTSTLELVSTDPADIRALTDDGASYRLFKSGLSVTRYRAECAGRQYRLNRISGTRREIIDATGTVIARTRAMYNGDLEVDGAADTKGPVSAASGEGNQLAIDLGFMTWALTYVDTPTRRTRG